MYNFPYEELELKTMTIYNPVGWNKLSVAKPPSGVYIKCEFPILGNVKLYSQHLYLGRETDMLWMLTGIAKHQLGIW
jgi:hypothetical protein